MTIQLYTRYGGCSVGRIIYARWKWIGSTLPHIRAPRGGFHTFAQTRFGINARTSGRFGHRQETRYQLYSWLNPHATHGHLHDVIPSNHHDIFLRKSIAPQIRNITAYLEEQPERFVKERADATNQIERLSDRLDHSRQQCEEAIPKDSPLRTLAAPFTFDFNIDRLQRQGRYLGYFTRRPYCRYYPER